MTRQQRTAVWVAGVGIATGVTAMLLWPLIKRMRQQPSITVGPTTVERYDLDWVADWDKTSEAK